MELSRAVMMATDCMNYYGLYDRNWQFKLSRSLSYLGAVRPKTRVLIISKPYAVHNSEDAVLDTILHEIAHALTVATIRDSGSRDWHGPVWKSKAHEIGATPTTCNAMKGIVLPTKWEGKCTDCELSAFRQRDPKPLVLLCSFHPACKRKPNGGKIVWYLHGVKHEYH